MNVTLTLTDFFSLSPLLILLLGALLLLLLESFDTSLTKKYAFGLTVITLVLAFYAAYVAPESQNGLLTPWLKVNAISRFFTLFFLIIGLASALLSSSFFNYFEASEGEYFFLLLSAIFGLVLIGESADFLTLFLGLETLSISLYVLCGYMKKWNISQESSIKYFFMGALAASFLLYGIALVYGAVGSTSFDALLSGYQHLSHTSEKALFLGGIAFITLGLGFKAAIVPFHTWAPDVYEGASTPVTAFMAVGTKVGAFAAFTLIFLVALPHFEPFWNEALSLFAYLTLIYANFLALRQIQLRRFFAYSGISHAGFLLIPLIAGTPDALFALLFYLVVYAAATLGAFAILAFLDRTKEGVMLHDLHGLFKRAPFLAGVLTLCLLTLAGIPPTVGFFAKFYIFKVAFEAGYYGLVVVGLLMAILSAYYYLRLVAMMLTEPSGKESVILRSWPAALLGGVSFVFLIVLSCYPDFILALF